jgi:hypothetical protein
MQTVLSKKIEKLLSMVEEGDREDVLRAIEFLEDMLGKGGRRESLMQFIL